MFVKISAIFEYYGMRTVSLYVGPFSNQDLAKHFLEIQKKYISDHKQRAEITIVDEIDKNHDPQSIGAWKMNNTTIEASKIDQILDQKIQEYAQMMV